MVECEQYGTFADKKRMRGLAMTLMGVFAAACLALAVLVFTMEKNSPAAEVEMQEVCTALTL
jgi:hypothetical protein